MAEILELPNGERVEIPEGQDPVAFGKSILPAYHAGKFGPVKGNDLDPNAGAAAAIARAAGHPGDVLVPELGVPRSWPVQGARWGVREGLNALPYFAASGTGMALSAVKRPVLGAITRILGNAGVAAATNPEDPLSHAGLATLGGLAGEVAAPIALRGTSALAEKAGLIRSATEKAAEATAARQATKGAASAKYRADLSQYRTDAGQTRAANAAASDQWKATAGAAKTTDKAAAQQWKLDTKVAGERTEAGAERLSSWLNKQRGEEVAKNVGDLIEQEVPALSSVGQHPNLPALASKRIGAKPIETARDLYEIAKGGRGKEMLDQVAEATREAVDGKIGQMKLVFKNPQTGKPEAFSFDEAWAKRSAAGRKSGSTPGVDQHTWGLTKDEWDQQIVASLDRIIPDKSASAAYQAGLDVLRPAYALRKVLGSAFSGRTGETLDLAALAKARTKLGDFSSSGTAPNTMTRNIGRDLQAKLSEVLQHTPGDPMPVGHVVTPEEFANLPPQPPMRPEPRPTVIPPEPQPSALPPRPQRLLSQPPAPTAESFRRTLSPAARALIDAAASTPTGEFAMMTRIPGMIDRLKHFLSGGGGRNSDYEN